MTAQGSSEAAQGAYSLLGVGVKAMSGKEDIIFPSKAAMFLLQSISDVIIIRFKDDQGARTSGRLSRNNKKQANYRAAWAVRSFLLVQKEGALYQQ